MIFDFDWSIFWSVLAAIFAYKISVDLLAFIIFCVKSLFDR